MTPTTVRVIRTAAEAKTDVERTHAQTRNGQAQLGGLSFVSLGLNANARYHDVAWIEFLNSQGTVLNAGATVPVQWLDTLCVEWAKARDLWPKIELCQVNVAELEEEVFQLQARIAELEQAAAQIQADLVECGINLR